MDDSLDSVATEQEAKQLYVDLCALWGEAGMWPRKWATNSAEVLHTIPKEQRMATLFEQ